MVDDVYASMLEASPDDMAAMLDCVDAHADRIGDRADTELAAPMAKRRTFCRSPAWSPRSSRKSDWESAAAIAVVDQLVTAPADAVGGWTRHLRAGARALIGPLLEVFQDADRPPPQRVVAGDLLVAFAPDEDRARVARLVDLLEHATSPSSSSGSSSSSRRSRSSPTPPWRTGWRSSPSLPRDSSASSARSWPAGRRTSSPPSWLWAFPTTPGRRFEHSPEPTVRSMLVENLHVLGIDPAKIVERAESRVRRQRPPGVAAQPGRLRRRTSSSRGSRGVFRDSSSSGASATTPACTRPRIGCWTSWSPRELIQPVVNPGSRDRESGARRQRRGADLVLRRPGPRHGRVPRPDRVRNGLAGKRPRPRGRRLRRNGAAASGSHRPLVCHRTAKEVTVDQFLAAWNDLKNRKEFLGADGKPIDEFPYAADKSPDGNCPIIDVEWFMAAAYCNWLSQQEGLPSDQWCYRDPRTK